MKFPSAFPSLKVFGFLLEIATYAVWLHHRHALSTADMEDLLAVCGMESTSQTSLLRLEIKSMRPRILTP